VRTRRLHAAVVAALAVALYANTLGHGYALDDTFVIERNAFTQAGLSGLPRILTSDYLRGYLGGRADPVAGGRYRPLSLATFALETALFGPGHPFVGHLINVLLYALCCALFYQVATELLGERTAGSAWLSVPFVAALLFTVHPLHTEVVANIKSRDEILALLFGLATLSACLRAASQERPGPAVGAAIFLFLALFSKETAIPFLVLAPLSLWWFRTRPARAGLVRVVAALAIAAGAYVSLRAFALVGDARGASARLDLLNNPFLGASTADAYATVMYTLGRYLLLLVWPHPLTHDYAPFHIAIVSWSHAGPWIALVAHVGLVGLALTGLRACSVPSYAAAFYLATLAIPSNLFFPVGTFMAERFLFMPSAGAALGVAWALLAGLARVIPAPPRRAAVAGAVVLIAASALGALTVLRNPAWEDNYTLFTTDVAVSSDSALANTNAADVLLTRASESSDAAERARLERDAVAHLETALRIHPRYERALEMLAAAQSRRGDSESSLSALERLFALNPRRGSVAFNAGTLILQHHPERRADAVRYLEHAVEVQPNDADAHANLGVAYYQSGDTTRAIASLERAVALAPDRSDHRANLEALRAEVARPGAEP
jgi:cytochrome c-type biogenesis protein CcmH/NrfG